MKLIPKKQARRVFLHGILGASFAALAACSQTPRPVTQAPQGPEEAPAPTPTPTPEAQRNGVAVLVPLSGDNKAVGTSIANAAKMALLDSGSDRLRVNVYDTAGAGGAQQAVNDALAAGDGLILGPLLAENVRVVGPIADQRDVPVIAFSNDESVAGDNVYIMGFTPSQSIARSVRFARDSGLENFGALMPNSLYGQRAVNSLIREVEDVNGNLVALETYERSRSAIEGAVGRLNAKDGLQAVVIGDGGTVAKNVAPQLRIKGWIIGNELWAAERDLGSVAALRGAVYSAVPDGRFTTLAGRYRSRYNTAPFRLSSLGYDGMLLAVKLSQDWDFGKSFPERKLRDDDGFGGVDGIFRFRDNVAVRALEVRKVTAGGAEIVSPAASKF